MSIIVCNVFFINVMITCAKKNRIYKAYLRASYGKWKQFEVFRVKQILLKILVTKKLYIQLWLRREVYLSKLQNSLNQEAQGPHRLPEQQNVSYFWKIIQNRKFFKNILKLSHFKELTKQLSIHKKKPPSFKIVP